MKTAAAVAVGLALASCGDNTNGPSGDMGGTTTGSGATSGPGTGATGAGGASTTGATTGNSGSTTGGDSSGGAGPGAGSGVGGSPTTTTTGAGGAPVMPGQTLCGDVQLGTPMNIAAGTTVAICAGATVTAASRASFVVSGTLLVQGTMAAPVKMAGAQHTPGFWTGIALAAGGKIVATFAEIHDAATGVDARAGSTYDIDHILIDNTSLGLALAADGTVSHGTIHGLSMNQQGPLITVTAGAPHVVDTLVDKGYFGAVDSVIVNGPTTAPVFDHMEVADTHCAFHFNSGAGVTISHSYVHHNSYGLMVGSSTGTQILHNNFQDNSINVGACSVGISGSLNENYFAGAPTDSSCVFLTVSASAPAAYTSDVGPRP